MNCHCNPPSLAVIKTTQRKNENFGKDFFGCANGGCNFFSWIGAAIPASLHNNSQAPARPSQQHSSLPKVAVRLAVTKFEDGPPVRIWFSVCHSHSARLTQFYLTFSKEKRKYLESTNNWSFDFCMYDELVNQLQASDFDFVELIELPQFLVRGLKRYIDRIDKQQSLILGGTTEVVLNIEPALLDTLLPFQLEGIKYVIRHGGKALIGDDMVGEEHSSGTFLSTTNITILYHCSLSFYASFFICSVSVRSIALHLFCCLLKRTFSASINYHCMT